MSNRQQLEYSSQKQRSKIETRIFAKILKSAFKQYRKLWGEYLEMLRELENVGADSKNRDENKILSEDSTSQDTMFSQEDIEENKSVVLGDISDVFVPDSQYLDESPKKLELDTEKRTEAITKSPVFTKKRKRYSKRYSLSINNSLKNITDVSTIDNSLSSDKQHVPKEVENSLHSISPVNTKDDLNFSAVDSSLINDLPVENNMPAQEIKNKSIEASSISKHSNYNNAKESKLGQLGLSKLYNVETKVLSNGKQLKQTRLIFQPTSEDKDISSAGKVDSVTLSKSNEENEECFRTPVKVLETQPVMNKTFNDDFVESSPYQSAVLTKNKKKLQLRSKHVGDNSRMNNASDKYKVPGTINNYQSTTHFQSPWCSTQIEGNTSSILKQKTAFNVTPSKSRPNIFTDSTLPPSPIISHADESCDENIKTLQKSIHQEKLCEKSQRREVVQIKEEINPELSDDSQTPTVCEETYFAPAEQENENHKSLSLRLRSNKKNVTKKSKPAPPPVKKMLMSSYDRVPWSNDAVDDKAKKKADRMKMKGWSCWQCKQYYEALGLSEEELQIRKNQCSRHRSNYDEKPCTPPSFWDPLFPDTESSSDDN